MILSHKEIEEIAAAVTKDFNEFFFGPDTDGRRLPRGTPIDLHRFASSAGKGGLHSPMSAPIKFCSRWRQTKSGKLVGGNTPPGQPIRSGS